MCEFGMSRNVVNLVLIDLRDYLMIVIFNCCIYLYSQVHKYWDIDTILSFLALYTTTMDFK